MQNSSYSFPPAGIEQMCVQRNQLVLQQNTDVLIPLSYPYCLYCLCVGDHQGNQMHYDTCKTLQSVEVQNTGHDPQQQAETRFYNQSEWQQEQQQAQDVNYNDEHYEDEDEEYEYEEFGDPSFDVASDEVRAARGLVFAAPQVEWAQKYVDGTPSIPPIFTTRTQTPQRLPSGLPLKWKYTSEQLLFLTGGRTMQEVKDNEAEMNPAPALYPRRRKLVRKVRSDQVQKIKSHVPVQVTVEKTVEVQNSQGAIRHSTSAQITTLSNFQQPSNSKEIPVKKSSYLLRYLENLSLEGKNTMGDLTQTDVDRIRNDVSIPSGFKNSLIRTFKSNNYRPNQPILEFNNYLCAKKNNRIKSKSSTSSTESSL